MATLAQSPFAKAEVDIDRRADGSVILRNRLDIENNEEIMPERLRFWARETPDRPFLSRPRDEQLETVTYAQALAIVDEWAAGLLTLGLTIERPLALVAENSIEHALLVLAAASVGIPVAVVSPALIAKRAAPFARLAAILDLISPGIIVADEPDSVAEAIDMLGGPNVEIFGLKAPNQIATLPSASAQQSAAARGAVTPETVAKLLFTSGSTGTPKPVINTQRMMVSNMQGIALVWPFLNQQPPTLVDWLPWNHTFGGNCCFNLALYFGGHFVIDPGKPTPDLVAKTVRTVQLISPSVYFNVPVGYEALLPHLEEDLDFASRFFDKLQFMFNASAGLPVSTRARLEAASQKALGRVVPVIGAWGSTETAPFATVIYFDNHYPANLGVPMPGTDIKLVPADGRTELRVRGPNVMPGYWRLPEATRAAFDDEGFYKIGDAGRLADPNSPEAGILFDGRVAENFKLSSGTWVNVGALRLALIAACKPLISDLVVTGEGRDVVGVLIFLNMGACRAQIDTDAPHLHPAIRAVIAEKIAAYNSDKLGSSTRVALFDFLAEPASADHEEITEKGYLNQRAVLKRRASLVDALYSAATSTLRRNVLSSNGKS